VDPQTPGTQISAQSGGGAPDNVWVDQAECGDRGPYLRVQVRGRSAPVRAVERIGAVVGERGRDETRVAVDPMCCEHR
jgi:hypothetical protein